MSETQDSNSEANEPVADTPVSEQPTAETGLDIGSQSEEVAVPMPTILRGRVLEDGTTVATGRRKTAVARVRIKRGSGKFTINGRPFEEFFCVERDRLVVESPLRAVDMQGQFDIWVRTDGGGTSGQAGAIVLGLARALQATHPELHGKLSGGGFLTRDGRMVERKKYGHKKARRSFQFSKR